MFLRFVLKIKIIDKNITLQDDVDEGAGVILLIRTLITSTDPILDPSARAAPLGARHYERKHRSSSDPSNALNGGEFLRLFPLTSPGASRSSIMKLLELEAAVRTLLEQSRMQQCANCGAVLEAGYSVSAALAAAKPKAEGVLCCTARPDDFMASREDQPSELGPRLLHVARYIVGGRFSGDPSFEGGEDAVEALVLESYQLPLSAADLERLSELWRRAVAQGLKRLGLYHYSAESRTLTLAGEFDLVSRCKSCDYIAPRLCAAPQPRIEASVNAEQLCRLLQKENNRSLVRSQDSEVLEALRAAGLGRVALGISSENLSTVEQLKLRMLLLKLARPSQLVLSVCGLEGLIHPSERRIFSEFANSMERSGNRTQLDIDWERSNNTAAVSDAALRAPRIALEQIECGPIKAGQITVPCAALSVLRGPSGSGKTTILSEVLQEAFRKRRISSLKCRISEGSVEPRHFKQLHYSPFAIDFYSIVGRNLGLQQELVDFLVTLPAAKLLGLHRKDLELERSRFSCPLCRGSGRAQGFSLAEEGRCEGCDGARFEPEVAGLQYSGLSYREILDLNLRDFSARFEALLKLQDLGEQIERLSLGQVSYGQQCGSLSMEQFQKLRLLSCYYSIVVSPRARTPALLLLDYPLVGLAAASRKICFDLLRKLADLGHTVVLTDNGESAPSGKVDHLIELGVS
ncbi:MAG: hypothetical protein K1X83_01295 [Oligoflexia bacterium]|nr:hypothetical protein [Oligoflexia bacterium]